jgi:hypothetical protein
MGEIQQAFSILVGKFLGKQSLERSRHADGRLAI